MSTKFGQDNVKHRKEYKDCAEGGVGRLFTVRATHCMQRCALDSRKSWSSKRENQDEMWGIYMMYERRRKIL